MTDAEKAARRAGAEAMREAAVQFLLYLTRKAPRWLSPEEHAAAIRALLLAAFPPEETTWVPIPFDGRQPLLSDGIYSAIRVDEYGNYEGIPLTQPTSSKETTP
jgi:hypothetical protein